jgi:AcrR family transcriptional regulator
VGKYVSVLVMPPIAGLRESKKLSTRTALVDCAVRLTEERGYHGFTISQLVDLVGVSRRTFSNYFAGKAECVGAISARWLDAALDQVDKIPAAVPVMAVLADVLQGLADQVSVNPTGLQVLAETEPELAAALHAVQINHAERIAAMIACRTGISTADARVTLLAQFCLAAGRTCIGRWVAAGRPGGPAGLAADLELALSLIDASRLVHDS